MESSTERESLLRQADHLWKMLDNMAENNPESYQRFIKKQLQEGSEHLKPPEPVFCLSCEIDKLQQQKLFKENRAQASSSMCSLLCINVCQWCQVPKPKTDNDAIPVKGGMLRKLDQVTQVYDVAFNPAIIEECARQDVNEQLLQLILDYTVDMTKLPLKRSTCKKLDRKCVGSMQDIISSIDERHQASTQCNSTNKKDQPQSLLDQLANINKEKEQEPNIVLPKESVKMATSNKKLIEEIPTSNKPTLRYFIEADKEKITVTIKVGSDVESIAKAELDVSENELELKMPGVPDRLLVRLPCAVDEDKVVAKYKRKTEQLCVALTCKQAYKNT